MLDVLVKRDLIDLTAVVSRYFGGTLLGAGGLVRAYGRVVSKAIDVLGIVERQPRHHLELAIGYHGAGRIEHAIRTSGYDLSEVGYGERQVTFEVLVETSRVRDVEDWIAGLTTGAATVTEADMSWVDVPVPATDTLGDA